ncbi:TPA: hypothetical protein HA239_04570 [Candidatus Woesearchaeota archaeon]|nr:Purine nucleoside phosphorylase [archaeon GW2011_AR15]MBS3104072.1 hypothetical protein [Candidatus Woesearchaeota archaeon]HIH41664.1 hypothetical protein [Candidatus Woesearchaeota archaeon]
MAENRVVVIGGSGVHDSPGFKEAVWETLDLGTPYGRIEYQEREDGVVFIPRHGHNVKYAPHLTQYIENSLAAAHLGDVVIATSAVGTYHPEKIKVKGLVIPDDYIDMTTGRKSDPYGEGITVHANPRPAFTEEVRKILLESGKKHSHAFNGVTDGGTYLTMDGSRFGTRAEGNMRAYYADLAGMTCNPEAEIMMYLDMPYALAAFVVDEDVDADHELSTMAVMKELSQPDKVPAFIETAIELAKEMKLPERDPRIATGIIEQGLERIANKYARQRAGYLMQKYK